MFRMDRPGETWQDWVRDFVNEETTRRHSLDLSLRGTRVGLELEFLTTDTIGISPGAVWHNGKLLHTESQVVTSRLTDIEVTMLADRWYYIYLREDGTGFEPYWNMTQPSDLARGGTEDIYLGCVYLNASSLINKFSKVGNRVIWLYDSSDTTGVMSLPSSGLARGAILLAAPPLSVACVGAAIALRPVGGFVIAECKVAEVGGTLRGIVSAQSPDGGLTKVACGGDARQVPVDSLSSIDIELTLVGSPTGGDWQLTIMCDGFIDPWLP